MIKRKLLTIIISIILALFILSASVACPILIRGLYYIQVDNLNLPERTGYSRETIIEAYDEMMDYCTGGGEAAGLSFGTGKLSWSESGKSHFDDVEKLFRLDIVVMCITGALLILYIAARLILRRLKNSQNLSLTSSSVKANGKNAERNTSLQSTINPYRFLNRGPLFWGPVGMIVLFAAIGVSAAINFNAFFVFFHRVFFPGKENWIFDYNTDQIINILPEEVFGNFALMILLILIAACAVCIISDFIIGSRIKKNRIQIL